MRRFGRAALFLVLIAAMDLAAFAQSATITTYVGPSLVALPVSGSRAISDAIGVPQAVATDGAGGFYLSSSSHHRVYHVAANGTLTLKAGTGSPGLSGDGGPAIAAQLNYPRGLAVDGAGNLFIADMDNRRIRKVTPTGVISTVATKDLGGAALPNLSTPIGVAVDGRGNLFIADYDGNTVSELSSAGDFRPIAGTGDYGFGGDGGPALQAHLASPSGVVIDGAGDVFIADGGNNRIRKVTPGGVISTVAGNETYGFSGDGGPASAANLNDPRGIAVDDSGNLFIADAANNRIRMVSAGGIISTVAGSAAGGFAGDAGPALSAKLALPVAVAVDSAGNLFIADRGNKRIRKVSSGSINTVAGISDDGGPMSSAQLNFPVGIAVDAAGNLFIADSSDFRIRKVTPTGIITTVAGYGTECCDEIRPETTATSKQLYYPQAVAVDSGGNLFIADSYNQVVEKVTPDGSIKTIAGDLLNGTAGFAGDGGPAASAQLNYPGDVAVDSAGNLFIADTGNNRIRKVTSAGIITTVAGKGTDGYSGDGGPAASAQLSSPQGVALDAAGNLFIADTGNNRIRRVTPDGTITTVAGNGTSGFSGDGGAATLAMLGSPQHIAVDTAGNLYMAESNINRIRMVTSAGIITTIAGGTYGFSGDGGAPFSAQLATPSGVAASGNTLYILDAENARVRKVVFTSNVFSITNRGATSLATTGNSAGLQVGYGIIQPSAGATTPAGLAIFDLHVGNVLVSETTVAASAPLKTGRIYAEVNSGVVNTGIAIANPNNQTATLNFFFTDGSGNDVGSGATTIASHQQIAKFLDQPPFNIPLSGGAFQGTFSFTSDTPVAVIATRGLFSRDFLLSTLPVVDTTALPNSGTMVVPDFADGGGWTTQILLVNPTSAAMAGSVEFRNDAGALTNVTVAGQTNSTFAYTVPPKSSQKIATSGTGSGGGSVRILPAGGGAAPAPLAIFSYAPHGVTVTEVGLPANSGTAFRVYVESYGNTDSGIAVANSTAAPAAITLELTNLDGSTTGLPAPVSQNLPAFGHIAQFLEQFFPNMPSQFKGLLRVSTTSTGISVAGVRTRVNERGDLLVTTMAPADESAASTSSALVLPEFADGAGYTTEFVIFSGTAGQSSSGSLLLFQPSGQAFAATLR
jgi:trimeric autotransporter adhesin